MDDSAKDETFAAAITAAQNDPGNDERWDELEQLADELQRPDEVTAAYREALDRGLTKDMAPRVAERAVEFCQAWYIDTPEAMPELLSAVVERYPDLDWAFERLVVLLTSSGHWTELLALHDRSLAATREESKRRRLLDDAARLAKDFADQPDRAADYLQQLLVLDPGNEKIVTSLERLLERRERYTELLALWRDRIPKLSPEDARTARAKIAEVCLDQLGEPQRAIAELRELVEESPGHADACGHLERILENEASPVEARREALSALRKTYQIVERREDVVRVLEIALTFVDADDRPPLRRECGNRLGILGRDEEAIAHFARLLGESPEDTDARRQIRQLARRSDRRDLHAQALLDAAETTEDQAQQVVLWLEAADVKHKALDDSASAIELYRRVLDTEEAEHAQALSAAHQLDELLAASNQLEERLSVFERLAVLERSPSFRRQLLAEAARLAEQLDDSERSLSLWREALQRDPSDLEALGAVIDMLERTERWEELVTSLTQRAATSVSPQQARADRVRAAKVQQAKLEQLDAAIDGWLAIRETHGEDHECLAALDGLMSETERWQDLGDLLSGAVNRERDETARRLDRLASIYLSQLEQPDFSLPLFVQAIELDPADGAAREGLTALLDVADCGKRAAEALARAYERNEEWQSLLELLGPRLILTESSETRAELLREAAKLHEDHGEDVSAAMQALVKAVPLDPRRRELRRELLRLAAETGAWTDVTESLREAAAALGDDPEAAAELRIIEAKIHEEHLDDWASAFGARQAASNLTPGDAKTLLAVALSAARAGQWSDAGTAAVSSILTLGRIDPALISGLEEAAEAIEVWSDLADSVAEATTAQSENLSPDLGSQLWGHVADWYRDHCESHEAASQAATKALALMPENAAALERVVTLQRQEPGPELIGTLLLVDKLGDERSVDALREASDLALAGDDAAQTRTVLERLYRKATNLWLADTSASGEHEPQESSLWALVKLVADRLEAEDKDKAARLLLAGADLPVDSAESANFSLEAARLLAEQGDRLRAIDAYRRALKASPDDLDTIRRLAELSEQEEQRSGSVALRERELRLTPGLEEKLALRLANSQHAADLEARSGRVASLLANLDDSPGHNDSLEALTAILDERGRHEELSEVLEQQANKLSTLDNAEGSAALWAQVAAISEQHLRNAKQAIGAHERVVALTPSNPSLDALARLHLEAEAPTEAVKWLQQRLETSAPKERVAVLLKLARTQLQAGREPDAIATLQTAFGEAPQNAEVRRLLIQQLRKRENWQALANTLAVAVEHATDDDTVLAYAREAAELFYDELDAPEETVPVLRKAVALAPDDRKLRSMLGEGLRVVGELDEACELLTTLVGDFGRRGSKQRAAVHLLLAKVLHAQDNHDEAIKQLDIASKMDTDNVVVLRTLAELSREAGQLERAERALRTLLLTARRLQADASGESEIGTSEVLFELSSLASARGQQEQAEELSESAIESLAEGDAHAPRLQTKLRERGEYEPLIRLLNARLNYVQSPYHRGLILGEKATILAEKLERPAEALDARIDAIDNDPGSPLLHDGAWELAVSIDQLDRYLEHLDMLLVRARRDTDAMVRCELFLRMGEVAEKHKEDFVGAGEKYEEAKETGVREVDVLRALARIAGAKGDEEEQIRLLNQLASLGEDQAETRASALYRVAEVQLANVDSLDSGLEALRKALDDSPNLERAAGILRRATEQHENNNLLLDAYEQVARDSDDDPILLHFLERRANHPEAVADQVREAVTKAQALEEGERAESLMERAVEIGRNTSGGLFTVDWALLGLAERCKDQGDVEGAIRWLEEAGEVADPDQLFALSREIAKLASEGSADPKLAAKLYERLRERDPAARGAWEPLVGIYRQQGDVEALERVVSETLDSLANVTDRNTLRVELGRTLLDVEGREDDATAVLRDALIDDPGHVEALTTLSDYFEKSGQTDELIALLAEQLAAAQQRGDATAIKASSLRLGGLLEPSEAIPIYRQALDGGDDADLLRTLLDVLAPDEDLAERASLTERLLALLESSEAALLALELAGLFEELDDHDGKLRALTAGLDRAPEDDAIRSRLEEHYRERGNFAGLVDVLTTSAERADDPAQKLTLLRETAVIYRDQLNDPQNAIELLRQAVEAAPDDAGLCSELASCLSAGGDHNDAIVALDGALDRAEDDGDKLKLLRGRAAVRAAAEDLGGSVADLEEAFILDPAATAAELEAALDQQRVLAADSDDAEAERAATLRCVEVMMSQSEREEASQLLTDWTERAPNDVDALHLLRDLEVADERWEGLASTCAKLIELESDEAQIDAAAMLLNACEQLGEAANARDALEHVWQQQPDNTRIRGEVRRLYEQIGAHAELAKLLLDEAEAMEDPEEKVGYLRWAGEALLSVGDITAAIPALTQVLELKPDDANARCLLADANTLMGRYDEALILLDEAISTTRRGSPDLGLYHQRKAYVAQAQGDQEGQLEAMKKAHQCGRKNAPIACELADLAEELEQWDLAAQTLRTIATLDTDCPITPAQSLIRQGRIALRGSDKKRALLCARRAKMADSDSEELKAFLEELGEE